MIYKPHFEQSDWSDYYNHGRIIIIIVANNVYILINYIGMSTELDIMQS